MALTDAEVQLIEEGITLAISAVLAAVRAAGNQGPIDWNSVRITTTPEMALAAAKDNANASNNRASP